MAFYIISVVLLVIHNVLGQSDLLSCSHPDVCCVFGKRYKSGDVIFSLNSEERSSCFSVVCNGGKATKTSNYKCDIGKHSSNILTKLFHSIQKIKPIQKRSPLSTTRYPTTTTPSIFTTTVYNPTPLHCFYQDPVSGLHYWWHGGTTHYLDGGRVCRCEYWGAITCHGGVALTTTTTTTLPTTLPNGCYENGKFYRPGETISSGQQDHWCYYSICDHSGNIIHGDDFNCNQEQTTIPTMTTTTPFYTTPLFCFFTDPHTKENHVWVGGSNHKLNDGTMCRCEYWGRVNCDDTAVGKK